MNAQQHYCHHEADIASLRTKVDQHQNNIENLFDRMSEQEEASARQQEIGIGLIKAVEKVDKSLSSLQRTIVVSLVTFLSGLLLYIIRGVL